MKRISRFLSLLLVLSLSLCALILPASAAFLGSAAAVLSEDVRLIKTGLVGEKMTFRDTDFKTALGVSDVPEITITALPASTEGTLLLGGRRVSAGQTVNSRSLGSLLFVPASSDVKSSRFTFQAKGYAGGADIACELRFIEKVNYAPTVDKEKSEKLSVWTQSGISVYGSMSGSDPEGDTCEYIVLSYPKSGKLTVTDKNTGDYRYTPSATYTGTDKFSYVIRDEYGNYSDICQVRIQVDKKATGITYVDMEDRPEYNAALMLSAAGIFEGKTVGDDRYFLPEETVTRAEFVAMALKVRGIKADSSLSATYFDDNSEIPSSLVGYVATAQKLGIVHGAFDGKNLNFRPNDKITSCEAAIVLSAIVGRTADTPVAAGLSGTVPVWARTDVSAMVNLGILTAKDVSSDMKAPLTRAAAAVMLFRLSSVK